MMYNRWLEALRGPDHYIKRMNSIIKERWLEALRSNQYTKGKKALRSSDSFCCLGVLCDTLKDDVLPGYWRSAAAGLVRFHIKGSTESSLVIDLNNQVRAVTGLSDLHELRLMQLNDNSTTFEPVIAYIEKNL